MSVKKADYGELSLKLRKMKFAGMADELDRQAEDPNIDLRDPSERIEALINAEWTLRYNKKLNRFMKQATLRYPAASFDESIYDPSRKLDTESLERLAECEWINDRKNLLITGRSSTGKTYIGNALAINAVRQFRSVRYIKASYLMSEMEAENLKGNSLEYLKKISSLALLVIDDFGLMDLDPNKCRNLFEVLDSREGKGSTMIISQLPVSAWYDLFKDNTYADACMERAIRGAYRLEFNGKNMREPSKN